jgi:hypothetical protein
MFLSVQLSTEVASSRGEEHCILTRQKEEQASWVLPIVLFCESLIHGGGGGASWPNYISKVPPLNTITLTIKYQYLSSRWDIFNYSSYEHRISQ